MLKELNSLINVRNFLTMLVNDMTINNIAQEKWNAINKKLAVLTKQITNMALELDVEQIVADAQNLGKPIYSTLEVKTVDQLDKLSALGEKIKPKVKAKLNEMAK